MTHHATGHPSRIPPKPREKGSAHGHVHHERRHKTTEGRSGYIGPGATLDDVNVQLGDGTVANPYPGIILDSNGLTAYNAGGVPQAAISAADGSVTVLGSGVIVGSVIRTSQGYPRVELTPSGFAAYNSGGVRTIIVSASDGSVTVNGTGIITGGTFQTSVGYPKVVMDGNGIRGYTAGASQNFNLSGTDGSLTIGGNSVITGGTIQTSSNAGSRVVMDANGLRAYDVAGNNSVNIDTTGALTVQRGSITLSSTVPAGTGARVTLDSLGIKGFDATNTQKFFLDSTTGFITATGIVTAQPGSSVPWQTTNFFIGGGNLLNNASAEDPTAVTQMLFMNNGAGVTSGGFALQYGSGAIAPLAGTATITIASPGVVTLTGHGFVAGDQVQFTTTGALPTGLVAGTTYYVIATGLTANSFEVSATPSGAAINTSGTQSGTHTATGGLPWNTTAAMVQAALSSAGVLPVGVTVSCTGGPLPSTPVVISIANAGVVPTKIAIAGQTLVGGSIVAGTQPVGWTQTSTPTGFIPYANAFHGGNVFRLNATAAGSVSVYQVVGLTGIVPGVTAYTVSAYFRAPIASRQVQLALNWLDANQATIASSTVTSTWSTSTSQWQRLYNTATAPVAATRQQIAIVGAPTGGNVQLIYNGQTTAAIPWNSSLSTVVSALQALSNVGASGCPLAFATGGPWPGTPITVSFVAPPAATPATMTYINALTGGASPNVVITNNPVVGVLVLPTILGAALGEQFYIDSVQLECGDAPTAFSPRPDEIVANTVQANMINVAQLSALSANLGTVTAGNITGVTITGALIQTASGSVAKSAMDSMSGFYTTDASGNKILAVNSNVGVSFAAASDVPHIIAFRNGTTGDAITGTLNAYIMGTASATDSEIDIIAGQPTFSSSFPIFGAGITIGGGSTLSHNRVIISIADLVGSARNMITAARNDPSGSWDMTCDGVDRFLLGASAAGTGMGGIGNAIISGTVQAYGLYTGISGTTANGVALKENKGHTVTMDWISPLNFNVDGTFVGSVSTAKFKRNIKPIASALSKIKALQGVTFEWTHPLLGSVGKTNHGMIAEQVVGIVPDAVTYHGPPDVAEPQLGLYERPIVSLLVEAVKELGKRIDPASVLLALTQAATFEEAKVAVVNDILRQKEEEHFESVLRSVSPGAYYEDTTELEETIGSLRTHLQSFSK